MRSEPRREGSWFGHSGDLGDIIYALPTIRAAGGGDLMLYHKPGRTTHGMDEQRVAAIKPLLEIQPYIKRVIWCPHGHEDHNLNGFRDHHQPGRNIADMHLATHGFNSDARHAKWLSVDFTTELQPVIFCRSERYQNGQFPWKRVWKQYRHSAVFLGGAGEHERFCVECGHVPFRETANLLEAARIIAGAKLCVANQSVLHAIAEGLKHNTILEVCPSQPNCIFERIGKLNGWNENIELPALD